MEGNSMIGRILEITFVAVLVYLVLSNAGAFSVAMSSITNMYTRGVQTLQGRG
jgi:hypothetical protein